MTDIAPPPTDPVGAADTSILPPFIQVIVHWALHHRWQAPHPSFSTPPASHTLWLVLRGAVTVAVADKTHTVTAGTVFLCGPHVPRSIWTEHHAEWLSIGCTAEAFHKVDLLTLLHPPRARILPPEQREPFEMLFRQLVREWGGDSIPSGVDPLRYFTYVQQRIAVRRQQFEEHTASLESDLICEGLARSLFGLCWRLLAPHDLLSMVRSNIPPWLPGVLRRADEDPAISVAELAQGAHLSPARFRAVFHDWTGSSPQQYLTNRRMGTARQLLAGTDQTVASIASSLGMHSLPTFTRLFKTAHGVSPARYRQLARQGLIVPEKESR